MKAYHSGERWELFEGDCRNVMRLVIADESIDAVVTDPPYELGFMGKGWDKSGIANDVTVWREALRVLKPGGHMLAFSGSRTYHRTVCAIEDAGFEIRDQIMWVYGSGFPKSHNLSGEWDGWGTALKPAHEPIVVARKPLIGTVAMNVERFGTGAINVDGGRIDLNGDYKSKANGRPSQTGLPDNYDSENANQPDTLGRWPANLIHDGSDEVLALFPTTTSGKPCGMKAGNNNKVFGQYAGGIPVTGFGDSGSAARFFYCAKTTKQDRSEGCEHLASRQYSHDGRNTPIDNAYQRNSNSNSNSNNHPTVKPTALMQYLCRLITPPNGTVLDPFAGSGSTGKAAMREGFKFIGIELSAEYVEIAKARIQC